MCESHVGCSVHVQYNPNSQNMSEYVDMGDGVNESDIDTEALVFMMVGMIHWKAPIAYYLTNSLSPDSQKVLIVHEGGIRVLNSSLFI